MRKFVLILLFLVIGCSLAHTYKSCGDISILKQKKGYCLRIKTGNYSIDKAIYETAISEFGKRLSIATDNQYDGIIKITFSSGKQSCLGTQPGFELNSDFKDCWFTGDGYGDSRSNCKESTGVVEGYLLTWQNAIMTVKILDTQGEVLWSADYTYRGGYEISSFYVNTAIDAARLCVKRMATRFDDDFKNVESPGSLNKSSGSALDF